MLINEDYLDRINLDDEIEREQEVSVDDVEYPYSMLIGFESQQKAVVFDVKSYDSMDVAEEKVHSKCHRYYHFLLRRLHWAVDHMSFVTSYEITICEYKDWFRIPEHMEHEWTEQEWLEWAAERQWNFTHNVEEQLCFVFNVKFIIDETTSLDDFYQDMHTMWDKGMNYPYSPTCILIFDWKNRPEYPVFRGESRRKFWYESVVEAYDAIFHTDYTEQWLEQHLNQNEWERTHQKKNYDDMSVMCRWLIYVNRNAETISDDYEIHITGAGSESRVLGRYMDLFIRVNAVAKNEDAKNTKHLIEELKRVLVEPIEKYASFGYDTMWIVVENPTVEDEQGDLTWMWNSYGMQKNPVVLPKTYRIGGRDATVYIAFFDPSYEGRYMLVPWGRARQLKKCTQIPNNLQSKWNGILNHSTHL